MSSSVFLLTEEDLQWNLPSVFLLTDEECFSTLVVCLAGYYRGSQYVFLISIFRASGRRVVILQNCSNFTFWRKTRLKMKVWRWFALKTSYFVMSFSTTCHFSHKLQIVASQNPLCEHNGDCRLQNPKSGGPLPARLPAIGSPPGSPPGLLCAVVRFGFVVFRRGDFRYTTMSWGSL